MEKDSKRSRNEGDETKRRRSRETKRRIRADAGSEEQRSSDEGQKQHKLHISFLLNRASSSLDDLTPAATAGDPSNRSISTPRLSSTLQRQPAPFANSSSAPMASASRSHPHYFNVANDTRSSSERRRTCEQCGKIFAQPADLKKQCVTHILTWVQRSAYKLTIFI